MTEAIKVAFVPVYVYIGYYLSQRAGEQARRALRGLVAATALFWALTIVSGVVRDSEFGAANHRWLAHSFVIAVWVLAPVSTGLIIQRRTNPVAAIFAAVLAVGVLFLSEWTGYLGPSHGDVRSAETINRFRMMHQIVFPAMTGVVMVTWLFVLRPKSAAVLQSDRDPGGHENRSDHEAGE